jgi:hypothetical protein
MLLQADSIDETVQYLQRSIEHSQIGREIDLRSALQTNPQSNSNASSNPSESKDNSVGIADPTGR